MVRGPDQRQASCRDSSIESRDEGRHPAALAIVDHRREEIVCRSALSLRRSPACAGVLMINQALASIDIATGRNGIGMPEEGISQALLCIRDLQRRQTEEHSCEAEDEASST